MNVYSAEEIASFTISYCNSHKIQITNLKLQKLLYFIQGEGCAILNRRLIKEDFYAWQLGPVIPEIYDEYSIYSSLPIPQINQTYDFSEETKPFLQNVLLKYAYNSAYNLVELSHNQDPWKYNFEVFGNKSLIPFDSINSYFRGKVHEC